MTEDFRITVKVKDVSEHIFFSFVLADFDTEGVEGAISSSGKNILFRINEKQYSVSLAEMLGAIHYHTREGQ